VQAIDKSTSMHSGIEGKLRHLLLDIHQNYVRLPLLDGTLLPGGLPINRLLHRPNQIDVMNTAGCYDSASWITPAWADWKV